MSGLMDKAKGALGNKGDKDAQPGDKPEGVADNAANQQINSVADQAGAPKQADKAIDDAADKKINEEIPGGNSK